MKMPTEPTLAIFAQQRRELPALLGEPKPARFSVQFFRQFVQL